MSDLLRLSKYGLYCPAGDFYIDATGRVARNIVTHAHSDHARPGHHHYLTHIHTEPLIRARIGKGISVQTLNYGQTISMNGVHVSFFPAGHIFGSAQIRVEYQGEVWVVSGDYKPEPDNVCMTYEAVPCHTFVTESTFGLPVYKWPEQQSEYNRINTWWQQNREDGITSVILAYSLGKAQRILQNIDTSISQVFVHQSIAQMNDAIASCGKKLPDTHILRSSTSSEKLRGNLVITPPSFSSGRSMTDLHPLSIAVASGWAHTGKNMAIGSVDIGFVISDHADWDGLLNSINETRAERVITMHGYTAELARWLNEHGTTAMEIDELRHTPFQG